MSTAFGDETRFFFELTPERILDSVETLGVRCTGRCLALNSMENRVYEIEIELPDDVTPKRPTERFRIAKFYRPGRWTPEQIREEHAFLADLVSYDIPVIAPIADERGETLFEIPEIGIWFSLFPKAGGRNPDELDDEQLMIVGRLLARIHAVGRTRQAPSRITLTPEAMLLGNLAFLREANLIPREYAAQYVDVVQAIFDATSLLFVGVSPQRIHGDCHLGNLLWGSEGPFWVDFDDMANGPVIQDIWLVVLGRDRDARERLELLLEGYEQMSSFDRSTLRLIEPLRAMRMVHFAAWIGKRWEDPAFKRTFVEFGTPRYWHEQLGALEDQRAFIVEAAAR